MIKEILIRGTHKRLKAPLTRTLRWFATNNEEDPLSTEKGESPYNPLIFDKGSDSRAEFYTEEEMYTYKEKNFVDRVRVTVIGGKGGIGAVSYENTRKGLRGKACGGSGGAGGGIVFKATMDEPDLSYIRSKVAAGDLAYPGQRWPARAQRLAQRQGREGHTLPGACRDERVRTDRQGGRGGRPQEQELGGELQKGVLGRS
jgi:hypothetical protein